LPVQGAASSLKQQRINHDGSFGIQASLTASALTRARLTGSRRSFCAGWATDRAIAPARINDNRARINM
jgi:hypothetical protein